MCFGSVALLRDAWLGFRNFALLLCRCCAAAVAHLLPSIARSLSLSLSLVFYYILVLFLFSLYRLLIMLSLLFNTQQLVASAV
jgi:hypothetical protein